MIANLFGLLNTVGNNLQNNEEDVFKVKKELNSRDYYKREPDNGIIDSDLDWGIKSFQKDYGLKVDGIIKPVGETVRKINDLWGFNSTKTNKPNPDLLKSRKQAVLRNGTADFSIKSNTDLNGEKPWFEFPKYEEVTGNVKTIEEKAKLQGVDPDLIKSIAYLETTHGAYDRPFAKPSSIRPMNIRANFWKDLGYNYDQLDNIDNNIEAGTKLLSKIQQNYIINWMQLK